MEELELRWKKLSLLEVEGKKHDLSKEKKTAEYVLAAKSFTRRSINVEAVARTFRPLWRTKRNFEVSMAGDNVVLITFEWEVDAEKVIQGEPWMAGDVITVEAEVHGEDPSKTMSMEVMSSGGTRGCDRHVLESGTVIPQKQIPDFEARLEDIDEAINSKPEISKPNVQNLVHSLAMIGKYQNVGINVGVTEDLGVYSQNLKISRMNPGS
uniref:DUF4283 domain-containing protein n=1 Tax=Quercus lobata TaxID=97700 RepID=A0A7N2LPZ3_QUELO